jgi:hypothetical protein
MIESVIKPTCLAVRGENTPKVRYQEDFYIGNYHLSERKERKENRSDFGDEDYVQNTYMTIPKASRSMTLRSVFDCS